MDDIEQEIDLDQITDENLLQSLLDQTDDPDDRKVIRDRIKELKAQKAPKKAAAPAPQQQPQQQQHQHEKLDRLTNTRQDMLQQKKKEAEQHKQRTMAMYDQMAKSAPAGADKKLDTSILKPQSKTSPAKVPSGFPSTIGPKVDMVEDAIKQRQREAEERKKRILAAFDVAAKTQPAGTIKDVDFDVVNNIDVSTYSIEKTDVSTFQMSGGVPVFKKTPSVPSTPVMERKPGFGEEKLDAMERALRDRQRECEERKRKLLEQYQRVSREAAGPKTFIPSPL